MNSTRQFFTESSALTSLAGLHSSNNVPPSQPRNILAIGCDNTGRDFLTSALNAKKNVALHFAKDNADMPRIRADLPGIDFIFCDLSHADSETKSPLCTLRAEGERAPIMAVLPDRNFGLLAKALRDGADDWLAFPLESSALQPAVALLIARVAERDRRIGARAPLIGAIVASETRGDEHTLQMTASTDSAQIESFLRFSERLAAAKIPTLEQMYLRQALEEIVQNAKEWGNGFDASKMVRFECIIKPDRISFRVEDEGSGFDPSIIPDPSIDPKAHIKRRMASGKRMGGWGLFIARKRMDKMTFSERGNVVCITKLFRNSNP